MTKRILFLVNGLGLGNSTRCHAVIERLINRGAEVAIATSGNGLWYFKNHLNFPNVFEVEELHYGKKDGRLSIMATFLSIGNFVKYGVPWQVHVFCKSSEKVRSTLR